MAYCRSQAVFVFMLTRIMALLLTAPHVTRAFVDVTSLSTADQPLPFAIQSHPLTLSSELFDHARLGDHPFPTGAWWTNLVLDKGASTFTSMPYSYRVMDRKLHISYPFRVVLDDVIQMGFVSQIVLSATHAARSRRVIAYDTFGVTVRFDASDESFFDAHLVRGSPYVTVEYTNSTPMLETKDGLKITRLKRYDKTIDMAGNTVGFANYALLLTNGQIWHVFASDPSIQLALVNGQVVARAPYTGVVRVALAPAAETIPFLIESAPVYAIGGDVSYSVHATSDRATLSFQWKTRTFVNCTTSSDALLMLALPHHVDTLAPSQRTVGQDVVYAHIRGIMTGVLGATWTMLEDLPPIDWDYDTASGLFGTSDSDSASDHAARQAMRETAITLIRQSLHEDSKLYPQLAPDSYNFGKQIGREVRLLLIAKRLDEVDLATIILTKIKRELTAWLNATNSDRLVYDQTYGGLVTSAGLQNHDVDYGNGWYNDHHFHYGYLVSALAAVRKYDRAFIDELHPRATAMVLADIGTPLGSSNTSFFAHFPAQRYFPTARHKDWYVGHSYASGLFSIEVGKSQESSSESVNAYYALALFSGLDEEGSEYFDYARLLLAQELRATKKYWHMEPNSLIYEPRFAQNAMVGVLGDMSAVYSTWFSAAPECIHGINMIPFTPVTTLLLNEHYVAGEYDHLRASTARLSAGDIWKSVVVMDHAILDAERAWHELTTQVTAFDTWNSKTNALLWVATRNSWFAQKDRTKLTTVKTHDEDQCFGVPACARAGDNGTSLQCCSTLPGCCPSALACCPKTDPTRLPRNACLGEPQCAALGLGCCNSIDGCCEPDPLTGVVLGCCRDQTRHAPTKSAVTVSPSATTSAFCSAQPGCAALGLDCCGSEAGCCRPDPITGGKLDCCVDETSTTTTGQPTSGFCTSQPGCEALGLDCCGTSAGCCKPDPLTGATLGCCVDEEARVTTNSTSTSGGLEATCHAQPRCAAAKLDCCATSAGCCTPDSTTGLLPLDCCDALTPVPTVAASTLAADTCQNEPECAKAGLDCCLSPDGCCQPDPITGSKLLCCSTDNQDTAKTTTSPVDPMMATCHGELACLSAGANGTALTCCATPEGCCPGLLCCASHGGKNDEDTATSPSSTSSSSASKWTWQMVLLGLIGLVVLAAVVFGLTVCYRRRRYVSIDQDIRSWTCAALMVLLFAFFMYLVYMA